MVLGTASIERPAKRVYDEFKDRLPPIINTYWDDTSKTRTRKNDPPSRKCNADIVANYRAYSRGSARNGRNLSNRTSVVERNDARKWRPFRRERKGGVLGSRDLPERGDKWVVKGVRFQVVTACNQPAMHQPYVQRELFITRVYL